MSIFFGKEMIAELVSDKTSICLRSCTYSSWIEDLTMLKKYIKHPEKFKVWYDVFIAKKFSNKSLQIHDDNLEEELNCENFRKLLVYYFANISSQKKQKRNSEQTENMR